MPSLPVTEVPVEVWLDNILPLLPLSDLLRLGCTNRFFYLLTSDEPFWHRKLQVDFNFSGSDTARATGWKFIYRRLRNPEVYVWGEATHSRLGLPDLDTSIQRSGLPHPVRLRIPGVRIVNIVAGGMSFHALDVNGNVYVWGVLDGTNFALQSDGYSQGGKRADTPMRLQLPVSIRTLSCGRLHVAALDAASTVWTFTTWGRPFRLLSQKLDKTSPETTPVQVESGWAFTSILTQSGDVLVYWPYAGRMLQEIQNTHHELDQHDQSSRAIPSDDERNVIPCHIWDLATVDPVQLPPIPHRLPDLPATGLSNEARDKETKLIRIAGMDNNLIGLTNKGHVLRFNRLSDDESYHQGRWEYLPYFSEAAKVAEDEAFSGDNSLAVPETMHITHISAHFETFIAYSTGPQSVVLIGKFSTNADETVPPPIHTTPLKPIIHRTLQYRSVISVVLGDYHYGALTSTGKLLTWGAFSKGALGLGNPVDITPGEPGGFLNEQHRRAVMDRQGWLLVTPPEVQVPMEVRFDHGQKKKREKYCFAATAAGWHTGALVIDLEPDEEVDEEKEDTTAPPMPGSFPSDPPDGMRHRPIPITRGGPLLFRVGFAGRGAFRGRGGLGRGTDPN